MQFLSRNIFQCLILQDNGNFPAYYNIDDLQSGKGAGAPLDHNHTHFILVDNGTENQFGVEIKLRASLEQYISDVVQTGVSENQSECFGVSSRQRFCHTIQSNLN